MELLAATQDKCPTYVESGREGERAPLRKWLQMPGAAEWIDAPPSEEEGAMHEKGEGRQKGQEFRSIFLEISRLSVKA